METIEPGSISAELLARDDEAAPAQVVPPVVAIVVTENPGPSLDRTLAALAAQDYSSLSVLVLDNGSTEDPTPRIAAAMPRAFVRRRSPATLEERRFAPAANEALDAVEGAMFLFFCDDGVTPDPDAVRLLVEEAYRSNAGIVGPKVVDEAHPEILVQVGMAVDHFGVPFSGIEPDEVDQQQHDAVRDVFFVPRAAMLVRTDLFHELSGFDAATVGVDDVDLCWRARLAGARVIVAPDARVRRGPSAPAKSPREIRDETRARVRMMVKSYSGWGLLRALPVGFALALGEAVAMVLTGRVRRAGALLAGWLGALAHVGDLRRARAETQQLRRIDDEEVSDLMIHGSARLRAYVTHRMHPAERFADVSNRTRARMTEATQQLQRVPVIAAVVVSLLVLLGVRNLLFAHVPEVAHLRAWPGIGAAWATFTSPWRSTFLGSGAAPTPAFGLMAVLDTLLLGHAGFARSLVVGGALPVGMFGAYRVARPLARQSSGPAVATAVAYAVNPVVRNAVWHGELGALVLFALAPFVFGAILRAAQGDRHALLTIALLSAIAASVWPPSLLFALLVAIALLSAAPFVHEIAFATRALAAAAGATVVGILLCTPWVWSLLGADASTLGFRNAANLSVVDVLTFHTGRAGTGFAPWGIVAAAAVPLALATGERLVWTIRAWTLAMLCFALAWLPGRVAPASLVPAPDGVLAGAALALALAAGIGVAAVFDDLRRLHFGWRQVLTLVLGAGLVIAVLGFAADTRTGRFGLGPDDWPGTFSWMQDKPVPGGFRVLWIGDRDILPADAKTAGNTGYALTRDGPGDARALWAAPASSADGTIAHAIESAARGDTSRLGHLLAPAGIRYVAFVTRAAPVHGPTGAPSSDVSDALAHQLDLTLERVDDASVVYTNDAWIPVHAQAPPGAPLEDSLRMDPTGITGVHASRGRTEAIGPGTLLWSEAAGPRWHATADGKTLARGTVFGATNAFTVDTHAPVSVHYHPSLLLELVRALAIFLWIGVAAAWIATRRPRASAGR